MGATTSYFPTTWLSTFGGYLQLRFTISLSGSQHNTKSYYHNSAMKQASCSYGILETETILKKIGKQFKLLCSRDISLTDILQRFVLVITSLCLCFCPCQPHSRYDIMDCPQLPMLHYLICR